MYKQLINISWNFRCWQVYVFCIASRFRSWWGKLGRIMLQSKWIVHGFLFLHWIFFKLLHRSSFLLLCSRCSLVTHMHTKVNFHNKCFHVLVCTLWNRRSDFVSDCWFPYTYMLKSDFRMRRGESIKKMKSDAPF